MGVSTQEHKKTAALWVAQGRTAVDIAAALEKAPSTVQGWLRDPEFTALVEVHRERMMSAAEQGMAKLLWAFPRIMDEGIRIALDDAHRSQPEMIRYLTDKVIVPRSKTEVQEVKTVDVRVVHEISESLREIKEVRGARRLPPLLEGKKAAEVYGVPAGEDSNAER